MSRLLSSLIEERVASSPNVVEFVNLAEQNLERGEISVFYPGTEINPFRCLICWKPPGNGIAEIEIWGASGSGGRMCCCGASVAGNPGAYVKKTVKVTPDSFVSGIVGFSCGNASTLSFRGCSESTCITICHVDGCNCLCAEGGSGGRAICANTSSATSCCLSANFGLSAHILPASSAGCRMVCNLAQSGIAYGGDINCCGGFSCVSFYHCNPCCATSVQDHVAVSPGIFSKDGAVLTYNRSSARIQAEQPGQGVYQLLGALNMAGRSPTVGGHLNACWAGSRGCACYEAWSCIPMLPYGVPGASAMPTPSVRDSGMRGGHGAVRIKFIG